MLFILFCVMRQKIENNSKITALLLTNNLSKIGLWYIFDAFLQKIYLSKCKDIVKGVPRQVNTF